MRIRFFQLINNFYRDSYEEDEIEASGKDEEPLGDYCILGHFDAMDVETLEINNQNGNDAGLWQEIEKRKFEILDGKSNRLLLVCIPFSEEQDIKFWEETNRPFFFLSMIRFRRNSNEELNLNFKKIRDFDEHTVHYHSYEHSDVISVFNAQKYSEGIQHIQKLQNELSIYKMHTIFAIKESLLVDSERVGANDELIDVRLCMVMKDRGEVGSFIEELKRRLAQKNNDMDFRVYYDTLGSNDILIEVNNITFGSILEFYKTGNLLTHMNLEYKKSVFNIDSKILVHSERENDEKMDTGETE